MHRYDHAPELTRDYMADVWETLPGFVRPTFLLAQPELSTLLGCELVIASETFQYTGSFKFRAAYNLLSRTSATRVVAASSGNFGQAVAYASRLLGKQCTIIMPETSAQVKIAAVQRYGGQVDLINVQQIGREERVEQYLAKDPQMFRAPAYDNYHVVAGNSTLGKEIFQAGQFDVVIAPVGGGGLSSGIIIARDYVGASTEVIGAEPAPGDDAARSLRSGQLIHNEQEAQTIADGARTLSLGQLNWEILRQGIADVVAVPDILTIKALQMYFLHANLKVEPTGALTMGALLAQPERFAGKRVCCIVSGGNVDPIVYSRALQEKIN